MTGSTVSVVIPTYNRCESLCKTLSSLAAQTVPAHQFEVIVVDDGSSDDTRRIAELRLPYPLTLIGQENQGAAAARNRGAGYARGEVLIFLDDDITVSPGFIGGLLAELAAPLTIGVGVLVPPAWPDHRLFRDLFAGLTATRTTGELAFTECLSGLMGVRRADFERIGGWQEVAGDGRSAWGDVDFGYRGHTLGYRFRRATDAIGYHDDRAIEDWPTYCRQQERAAELAVLLFRNRPPLETSIPAFRDKGPVQWGADGPQLVGRKLLRQALSSPPSMWAMSGAVRALERRGALSRPLVLLYRWTISGHIYRGYRRGLAAAAGRRGAA